MAVALLKALAEMKRHAGDLEVHVAELARPTVVVKRMWAFQKQERSVMD